MAAYRVRQGLCIGKSVNHPVLNFFCTIGLGERERKHKWQFLPPSLPLLLVWTSMQMKEGESRIWATHGERVREEEASDLQFTATILDFRLWQLCIQYLL